MTQFPQSTRLGSARGRCELSRAARVFPYGVEYPRSGKHEQDEAGREER